MAVKTKKTKKVPTEDGTSPYRRLTALALSDILGVQKATPRYWVKHDGCPRNEDGTYDSAKVFKHRLEHTAEMAKKSGEVEDQLAALRAVKTEREKLRLGIESGRLIDAEQAFRLLQKFFNDARTHLESLPESIGLLLAEAEMRQLLVEESRRIVKDALRTIAASETAFYEGAISPSFEEVADTEAGVLADDLPAA